LVRCWLAKRAEVFVLHSFSDGGSMELINDNNRIRPRSASQPSSPKRKIELTETDEMVSRKPIYY
jgi:hypothetical protein